MVTRTAGRKSADSAEDPEILTLDNISEEQLADLIVRDTIASLKLEGISISYERAMELYEEHVRNKPPLDLG